VAPVGRDQAGTVRPDHQPTLPRHVRASRPLAEELVARAGLDAWSHLSARSLPGLPHLTEPG
jgi:hypothetical protein